MRTIVWFRGKDLRLTDHSPLREAVSTGEVIPLFVLDPYFFAPKRARRWAHRMQFLLDSLQALAADIAARGSRLVIVSGKSVEVVPRLFRQWRADRLLAHRWVEPFARDRDRRVHAAIGERFELFEGEMLLPPMTLRSGTKTPYSVFSQFARAFDAAAIIGEPLPAPRALPPLPPDVSAGATVPSCDELGLRRNPSILAGGEKAAHARLRSFLNGRLATYTDERDRPDLPGTSRLSADLKFGTLSVRQVWKAVEKATGGRKHVAAFLNELLWREFAYSTLWDRPELLDRPFRASFDRFPWRDDETLWQAWVTGRTGYPIVDASARQLLAEGFVHNRARMISASFLTKHLLIDYRRGEAHYLEQLTDGDWANNNMGWQWSAGCGVDAQPYFRVFSPIIQGEKFDPKGNYVRRWVPELARMPARFIHQPWEAPDGVLRAAAVQLGHDYPRPVVDHPAARQRFLALVGEQRAVRGGDGVQARGDW